MGEEVNGKAIKHFRGLFYGAGGFTMSFLEGEELDSAGPVRL